MASRPGAAMPGATLPELFRSHIPRGEQDAPCWEVAMAAAAAAAGGAVSAPPTVAECGDFDRAGLSSAWPRMPGSANLASAVASAGSVEESPPGNFSQVFRNALRPSTFPAADTQRLSCGGPAEGPPCFSDEAPLTQRLPTLLVAQRRGSIEGPNVVNVDTLRGCDKAHRADALTDDTPKFGGGRGGGVECQERACEDSPRLGSLASSRSCVLTPPEMPFKSAAALCVGQRSKKQLRPAVSFMS
mmetsp:Transcript_144449/g.360049  ORF Transcript_144449/g.360049 Transcript_144449/m.360049 type:complete len:244 (+) Transcript_144449:65-796(+)